MGRRVHVQPGGINLARLRRRAAWGLWTELLLRAALLPSAIMLTDIAAALFGLADTWTFLGAIAACAASLVWEGSRLRPLSAAQIDRRIEAASGLKHRPLAGLADTLATGGALGAELWQLHQARLTLQLLGARAGWPAPVAAAGDKFALRALLLLLLVSGLVVNGTGTQSRLAAAFTLPAWPFAGPSVQAWLTPPAYTGQAPLLITPGPPVDALRGSALSVIVNGSTDRIFFDGHALGASPLGPESQRADGVIEESGMLSIGPWWHRLARLPINAVPPTAPRLTLAPLQMNGGTLALNWQAADDYGLSILTATIQPPGFPQALPQDSPLPAATGPGAAQLAIQDSPYAGTQVAVTLHAVNLGGIGASSKPQIILLPRAPFNDPTAILLGQVRRALAATPQRRSALAQQLLQVAAAPPSSIPYAADLQLAALAAGLGMRTTSPAHGVSQLLVLMQQIEQGPDYAPSQALAQAARNLLRALAQGPPDAATLNRMLAKLQQALAAQLAAIGPQAGAQTAQPFDGSALNKLAQQIAADEQAGRMQQAQAELQQLAAAMQALQTARPMTAAQAAQVQAAGQAAQDLSTLIQNQAGLLDMTMKGKATAGQQAKLQADLDALRGPLARARLPGLPGLGAAGAAMQSAQDALAQQDDGDAAPAETGAIQNLQEAASAMAKAAQQSLAIGNGGEMPDQYLNGPNGSDDDLNDPNLGLQSTSKADAIEQEIIRLDADPNLPAATHAYLRRLLTPDP